MDNTVEIKFGADTQGLEDALKRAEESIENLEAEIEKIGKGARNTGQEFELLGKEGKVFEFLDKVTGGLGEEILNLGERTKDARKEAKLLGTGFKGAGASAKVAGKAMKSALISTGIGALIVLVGELIDNWDLVKDAITGADNELEKHVDNLEVALGIRSSYIGALKEEIKLNALIGKDTGELETALKAQLEKQIKINEEKEKTERADRKAKKLAFETVTGLENALEGIGFTPFNEEDKKEIDALTVSINKTSVATDRLKAELYKLTEAPEIKPVDLGDIDKQRTQIKSVFAEVIKGREAVGLQGLEGISDIPIPGLEDLPNKIQTAINKSNDILANWDIKARAEVISLALEDLNESASNIIENGLTDTFAQLGEVIGESLASGGNIIEGAGQVLLGAVGSLLTSLGKMAIQIGVGLIAVKLALKSLNPAVAIAGGIALVALGAVFSKGAKSLGSSGAGGSGSSGASSSSGGGRGSGGTVNYGGGGAGGGFGSVVFEIAGTKLVGVLSKTLKENSALSGKLKID